MANRYFPTSPRSRPVTIELVLLHETVDYQIWSRYAMTANSVVSE